MIMDNAEFYSIKVILSHVTEARIELLADRTGIINRFPRLSYKRRTLLIAYLLSLLASQDT